MGKIKRRLFLIAPLILIGTALIITAYFVLQEESQDDTTGDGVGDTVTFYVDDDTPQRLAEFLRSMFEDEDWEEAVSDNNADVIVTPDEISRESKFSELTLHQVWVIATPYEKMLEEHGTEISYVSPLVDHANLPEFVNDLLIYSIANETKISETSSQKPNLSLLPLQEINSTHSIVLIDGIDPLRKETWISREYPLITTTNISAPDPQLQIIDEALIETDFLEENAYMKELPDPTDFVTIMKTGTSVSGGPGWELCERTKGRIDYPIESTKSTLASADYTIISNETSFVDGCSQEAGTTSFCGKPEYIQNLIDIGTDIVSLTGNHMCDYGPTAFSETLAIYTSNEMNYFGGGANLMEAWTPLYIETNAGTITFVGYNLMGPGGVIATEERAGTAYYDSAQFAQVIQNASENSDIIWVDTHLWPEYGTTPTQDQITYTTEAATLGANIVTGVSSHEIQGMTFIGETPVFYGLGNFLFDQMWSQESRQGLALEVTLYGGEIRKIDLLPTIMYDYCQPRFAEGQDKTDLMNYFFSISSFTGE